MDSSLSLLKKFYTSKKLKFKELGKEISSNKLSYHLNKLQSEGIIKKENNYYILTQDGEKLLSYRNKEDSKQISQPIQDVLIFPYKNGKFLFQKRSKIPFKGILMPIGSKIKFNESIFKSAEASLFDDTGLRGDLEFKGVIESKTFKDGEPFLHYVFNVFLIKNLRGELKTKTEKGENFWLSKKEYLSKKNILTGAKEHLDVSNSRNFTFLEIIQHMKGNRFVKCEVVRKIKL